MRFEADIILLMLCLVMLLALWSAPLTQARDIHPYRFSRATRLPLYGALLVSMLGLLSGLVFWSADDVRSSRVYITLYFILGNAWIRLMQGVFFPLIHLNVHDDVFERGNLAASWACGGALLGVTFCFVGGNIGNGSGLEAVLYSAGLATAGAIFLWLALDAATRLTEAVTVDRDVASGLRAAGFWIALGLILGHAVAGNWVSFTATTFDSVRYGWPVLLLLLAAVQFELRLRPQPGRKFTVWHAGVLPAIGYAAMAWLMIILLDRL